MVMTTEQKKAWGKKLQAKLVAARKAGTLKKSVSSTKKAGLQFPVDRINRQLKKGNYAAKTRKGASVYMAAVLEYPFCARGLWYTLI